MSFGCSKYEAINQGGDYPLPGVVLRIVLCFIAFLVQFKIFIETIFKKGYVAKFVEMIASYGVNPTSAAYLFSGLNVLMLMSSFFLLGFYYFQPVVGTIRALMRNTLLRSHKSRSIQAFCEANQLDFVSPLETEKRVIDKQTKFLSEFNLCDAHKEEEKVASVKGSSLITLDVFLKSHCAIRNIIYSIYLMKPGGKEARSIYTEYINQAYEQDSEELTGEEKEEREIEKNVVLESLGTLFESRETFKNAGEFTDTIIRELIDFLDRWKKYKHHTYLAEDLFHRHRNHLSTLKVGEDGDCIFKYACVDKKSLTAGVQERLVDNLLKIQRKLARFYTQKMTDSKYTWARLRPDFIATYLQLKDSLAANLEHELNKRFPSSKSYFIDPVTNFVGIPNAVANGLLSIIMFLPFIQTFGLSLWLNVSACVILFTATFYTSYAFTYENVKKFARSLKSYRLIPTHHRNQIGYLNYFLGFAMGLSSGVFFYSRAKSILITNSTSIAYFFRQVIRPELLLAHFPFVADFVAVFFAVITLVCAASLYINQCLQSQRRSYDRGSIWQRVVSFSNAELRFDPKTLFKGMIIYSATIVQVFVIFDPLFALPMLKFMGHLRYLILMAVGFVWQQLFNNAYEKMWTGGGITLIYESIKSTKCYSTKLMKFSHQKPISRSEIPAPRLGH
tara:strand:+ start:3133 stop:5154 length:2022 start_codon:yes stop_codon:yes gene_type:complete